MNRREIQERHAVERYLQGRLTEEETAAFEEAYLADPDLLEEVQLTERLRDGLRQEARAHLPGIGKPIRRRRAPFATPRYAAAASLLLAVSLVTSSVLLVQNAGLRRDAASVATIGPTRVLPLVNVRGDAAPNVISAPSAEETTVLMIEPGFTEYDLYRATLSRGSDPILEVDSLARTYEDFVAVTIPASLLLPGDYEIALTGRMLEWAAEREPVLVTRTRMTVAPDP